MKKLSWISLALIAGLMISVCGWSGRKEKSGEGKESPISLATKLSVPGLDEAFPRYYSPVQSSVKPQVPEFKLPVTSSQVQNWEKAVSRAELSPAAQSKLLSTGLVSVEFGREDDVVKFYKELKKRDLPVFVTSDSILHLYHIQFDQTLKDIETREFAPDLLAASRAMQEKLTERARAASGEVAVAYWKAAGLFTVGLKLLDPKAQVPKEIKDQVAWELKHIEDHGGFPERKEAEEKSLYMYCEDYSQYVPRGHYTESEVLKQYFKAMMWYGRRTLLLWGSKNYGPEGETLVSPEEAKAQTLAAAAIAGLVTEVSANNRTVAKIWERIYLVTAFYVGFSDDLTIPEYRQALQEMFGASFTLAELGKRHAEFLEKAKAMRKPAIYSGTGAAVVSPAAGDTLGKVLDKTQGFRFMGQRYVPDSYIMGRLVVPTVTTFEGDKPGITMVVMEGYGPARGFPLGLDVLAVLGSDRALALLKQSQDSSYAFYDKRMKELRAEFAALPATAWQRNLYWAWLDVLRTLATADRGPGFPTFMNTTAWEDKQLNAALGSWSSLRHDTILYVKQSYTPGTKSVAREMPVVGYVEPVPSFYAKLLALTTMTKKGLAEMGVLDQAALQRMEALEGILERLLKISEQELQNQPLSEPDYNFIAGIGEAMSRAVAGSSEATQKTTMIADVHTDQNSKEVMEEGTGYLRLLAVIYKLPQGHLLVGAGPVYSYYEFRHPMSDRLTDEKWRAMLEKGSAPPPPAWTRSFAE